MYRLVNEFDEEFLIKSLGKALVKAKENDIIID